MTAHTQVGGARNITQLWMNRLHLLSQHLVDGCRREALVSAAIDADTCMTTDAGDVIGRVLEEHLVIIRIWSVPWVRQPEVLPYHDTMLIACLIQLLIANLSYPVANHIVVHLLMVTHGCIIFTSAIVEVGLREAPVTAQRIQSLAVDVNLGLGLQVGIAHLADTCLIGHL